MTAAAIDSASGGRPPAGSSPAGATATEPGETRRFDRHFWRNPALYAFLAALVPALIMARRVHQTTQMQYLDYWSSLLRFTNPDGSIHPRGFFSYQNEHPFVITQIVYYVDAKFLTGSNHELGYFSILAAVASLVIVWRLLPGRWSSLTQGLVVLAASAIMFCPTGAWNFVKGMSGTAWLTANVFALLAVLLARRQRTALALVAAALSILTYGTGFAAPVAIIAVAVLRRDRWWRWALPTGLLFGTLIFYKLTANGTATGQPVGHDPGLLLQTFLTNLSTLWDPTGGSIGLVAGAAGLLVLGVGFGTYWQNQEEYADLIGIWGVAVYSIGASVLISLGRSEVFTGDGAQARYVSLSALFWISVLVVGVRLARVQRELIVRAGAAVAAIAVFWGASPALYAATIAESPLQNAMAAGVRFDATDPFVVRMQTPAAQIPRLKALHSYPFVGNYTLGCGLKPDATLNPATLGQLPAAQFPGAGKVDKNQLVGGTREIDGWIYRAGHKLKCVAIIDSTGKIVGGGAGLMLRTDVPMLYSTYPDDTGFQAVTPSSESTVTLVLGFDDGLFTLPATALPTVTK
ncbi:hypothetical protein [Jatrophihabitans lederbergiae]|uniref:Glycosyltransferase RgtA/B/C/D-like domain-containing protein n=1 Tax=Jatrophihabitans lederbergiae TaxID=3075547 RepID=A0ABU2J5U8_9ACTN|nr:hypothetical protein [Jatrophihabitans sp. DSM 44399]MDT0260351.1 hypothetical protein [Jatrophihabitans sp. DSM 44399]